MFAAVLGGRRSLLLWAPPLAASVVALGLFVVRWGLPSIVAQGTHAAGERAVSVLREIGWAERIAVEQGAFDRDGDGRGELAPLAELTGHARVPRVYGTGLDGGRAPVLRPETYQPVGGGGGDPRYFRVGGYLFALYLAKKGGGAALVEGDEPDPKVHRFVAYAWPDARDGGVEAAKKERVFFLDEQETICQAENVAGWVGPERAPPFDAALAEPKLDAERCGPGKDGTAWRAWKKKR